MQGVRWFASDRDESGLGGMAVLAVAASSAAELPAVSLDELDRIADLDGHSADDTTGDTPLRGSLPDVWIAQLPI